MISQFFILSDRGDRLIYKDFRFDVPINACEKFLRTVRFWPGEGAPPVFNKDAVTYMYTKTNGIYFVITTKMNLSPCYGMEILFRIIKVIKDYCGVLSEDAIRKNFVLIYELADELIDFGYPQDTSTNNLKAYVFSKVVQAEGVGAGGLTNANKSIVSGNKKATNEIYVDVKERLSIMFNAKGEVLHSSIDGSFVIKSFLSGNPTVKMLLPAHLVIGKDTPLPPVDEKNPTIVVDDMNFHKSMNFDQWDEKRLLTFVPQEGEFVALNYRSTSYYKPPFIICATVNEKSSTKIEVIIKIISQLPQDVAANNVFLTLHAPVDTTTCNISLAPNAQQQLKEYREKEKRVLWMLKKVQGSQEYYLQIIYNLDKPANQFITKEIGPILANFEIPNYQLSGLKLRGLSIDAQQKNYSAQRYIRYNTNSNSYTTRI